MGSSRLSNASRPGLSERACDGGRRCRGNHRGSDSWSRTSLLHHQRLTRRSDTHVFERRGRGSRERAVAHLHWISLSARHESGSRSGTRGRQLRRGARTSTAELRRRSGRLSGRNTTATTVRERHLGRRTASQVSFHYAAAGSATERRTSRHGKKYTAYTTAYTTKLSSFAKCAKKKKKMSA